MRARRTHCPRAVQGRPRTRDGRAARELEDLALGGREHLREGAARRDLPPGRLRNPIEPVVVAERIVVVQGEPPHAGRPRHLHHVLDRAVTPADPARVLGAGVLRIVDEEVGPGQEVHVSSVFPRDLGSGSRVRERPSVGLVVGRIDERHPIGLQAVSEREGRMVQVARGDADVGNGEGPLDQVVVSHGRPELLEADGKVHVLHLAGERLAK